MPPAPVPTIPAREDGPQRLKAALDAGVPQVYMNGFMTMLGTADVMLVMERNDHPAAILNMSYTTAKTLALALGQTIAKLEEYSGREMLTTEEVASKLMASEKKDSK